MTKKYLILAMSMLLAVTVPCTGCGDDNPGGGTIVTPEPEPGDGDEPDPTDPDPIPAKETFTVTNTVPVYGNAYITTPGGQVKVDNAAGIRNWSVSSAVVSMWFRVGRPGTLHLALYGTSAMSSTIEATVNGETMTATALKPTADTVILGKTEIAEAGYVRVDLKGVKRSGVDFGQYSALKIGGSATEGTGNEKVTYVPTEGDWPYWGRRGPSVHMKYDISGLSNVRCFYNELTVPEGMDPYGMYAMANGFTGGYMGMQVAGDGRRVLFSVWSTYTTDNPNEIPDEYTVEVVRKGAGVTAKEFGGEGSGGQSFLPYDWKAGETYKFLTEVVHDPASNSTTYTGYFCGHDGVWRLITAMRQPHPSAKTYLNPHSFLENFQVDYGWIPRRVDYNNQWAMTADGVWHELKKGTFTNDSTAQNGIRLDYAGGADENGFYLRNCGFFNDKTDYGTVFTRTTPGVQPDVDLEALSKL